MQTFAPHISSHRWRSYRSLAVVPWCKGPRGVRRRLVATASNSSAPKSPQYRSEVLNFLAELLSEDNPDLFAATEPSKVAHETDGLKPEAVASFIRPTGDIPARKADFSEISIITSYNWIDTAKPTIIVPGHPHAWQPKPPPFIINQKSGTLYVDQDGYRLPDTPLLPIFVAADAVLADINWRKVDVVTDQRNLRKLMNWVRRSDERSSGRIDLQLVGRRTLLLEKWVRYKSAWSKDNNYGVNIERFLTQRPRFNTWVARSTGYSSVVNYKMGDLNMIVRSEVDAYIPQDDDVQPPVEASPLVTSAYNMRVVYAGVPVSSDQFIELKSRHINPSHSPEMRARITRHDAIQHFPQLLFSQTPAVHIVRHDGGVVKAIDVHGHDDPIFSDVKTRTQWGVGELVKLLHEVRAVVAEHAREHPGERSRRFSLVRERGELDFKLYEQVKTGSFLPQEVLRRFAVQRRNPMMDSRPLRANNLPPEIPRSESNTTSELVKALERWLQHGSPP